MKLLEKHFDLAFTAPNGVQKLRELILTFAMQGKLVPQDPNDQPASELLKAIEAEKQRLVKEGKIKQPKPLPEIKPEEIPYELPKSWEWVRLGKIGEINPRNSFDDDREAGFVPMPLISSEYGSTHKFETRKWSDIKKGYTHFADGDVSLAKITPCFENGKSCVFEGLPNGIGAGTTELHIFRNTFKAISPEYLLAHFKNPKYITSGTFKMTGSAGQKRVPTDFFILNPVPLPPIAEQRRIVAKIDQLMARCDELEKLRGDRNQKRITIHTAALDRLLTAKESNDFSTAWHFITQHFGELYSVKENVAELRKAILQLAVMGKLVPQDPKDEPASELLKAIEAEKRETNTQFRLMPEIKPEDVPHILPKEWEWVRLGNIFDLKSGYSFPKEDELESGKYMYLKVGEMNSKGNEIIITSTSIFLDESKRVVNALIPANSIIFPKRGGAIATNKKRLVIEPICVDTNIMAIICPNNIELHFVYHWVLSLDLATLNTGTSVPQINNKDIYPLLFPLPPLAEQRRIVAKIDQLMALCDRLEHQIEAATDKRTELLKALVAQV